MTFKFNRRDIGSFGGDFRARAIAVAVAAHKAGGGGDVGGVHCTRIHAASQRPRHVAATR
jgi:hypothetical protein